MEFINTADTLSYMYRYLLKYVGTYRVKAEYDWFTNDFPRNENSGIEDSFEDLYIPCSKGVIKHTYLGNDILALCFYDKAKTGLTVFESLQKKYPKLEMELDDDTPDVFIYFQADDIKKIATIVKPKTAGAKINPFSDKNLPKMAYKIPSKNLTELYAITHDLNRIDTMQFFRQVNKDYIAKMPKALKQEIKSTRLGQKEFFHYKGLWADYMKYVKKKFTKYQHTHA